MSYYEEGYKIYFPRVEKCALDELTKPMSDTFVPTHSRGYHFGC
jgi:hypothetical protein